MLSAPASFPATVQYLAPSETNPLYIASVGGADAELGLQGQYEEHTVSIEDGRSAEAAGHRFSLDAEGFKLIRHESAIADFNDKSAVDTTYEEEVKRLVGDALGAKRVEVFDHTWRADSKEARASKEFREPSAVIHNDYTDRSAPTRVRDILPDEADDLLSRRFAIVNVWRPIGHPAETSMLALCDARSMASDDLVASERRAKDRIGEILMATYNPAHRWVCFPSMTPDEALLLKTFDSTTDGRARFAIHTAFDNPSPPVGAKPRESLETRTFAFF